MKLVIATVLCVLLQGGCAVVFTVARQWPNAGLAWAMTGVAVFFLREAWRMRKW